MVYEFSHIIEYILGEMVKRIVSKRFSINEKDINTLANNIFAFMKDNHLCRSKDTFRSNSRWLRKFFDRNREVSAMTHSVSKAPHVPPWMLEFSDIWLFFYDRIVDPERRDEAAVRLVRRILADKKIAMKSKKRREEIEEMESSRSSESVEIADMRFHDEDSD